MFNSIILEHPCFVKPVFLDRGECKATLGLEDKIVITSFGFIGRHKNIDLIIKSLVNLPKNVVLLIAGEANTSDSKNYLVELKQLIRELNLTDRVLFYGYVPDINIPVVMSASDLLVYPYKESIQSGSVYYPLAYGIPVLASNVGGFKELEGKEHCINVFNLNDEKDLEIKLNYIILFLHDSVIRYKVVRGMDYCSRVRSEALAKRVFELYGEGSICIRKLQLSS